MEIAAWEKAYKTTHQGLSFKEQSLPSLTKEQSLTLTHAMILERGQKKKIAKYKRFEHNINTGSKPYLWVLRVAVVLQEGLSLQRQDL